MFPWGPLTKMCCTNGLGLPDFQLLLENILNTVFILKYLIPKWAKLRDTRTVKPSVCLTYDVFSDGGSRSSVNFHFMAFPAASQQSLQLNKFTTLLQKFWIWIVVHWYRDCIGSEFWDAVMIHVIKAEGWASNSRSSNMSVSDSILHHLGES